MGTYGTLCTIFVLLCAVRVNTQEAVTCDPIDQSCKLSCDYGFKRVDGCPVCECGTKICQDVTCMSGRECREYKLTSGHAISRCVDPSLPDKCHAPLDKGPCDESNSRVFYNTESDQCEAFIYGGCDGNENNFASLEECQTTCVPQEHVQVASTCPDAMCMMVCDHGFKKDNKGCNICECADEPMCNDFICARYCNHGFKKDDNGCDICECEAPKCNEFMCARYCESGFKKDENGCDICDCKEAPKCNEFMCARYCEFGFKKDENGCDICDCNEAPKCNEVMCARYCEFGFKKDEFGCNMCDCEEQPKCNEFMCARYCEFGFKKNENGCDICDCNECPLRKCEAGHCLYGYKNDASGCRTCECAEKPTCNEVMCAMFCENGFEKDDRGCDVCRCRPRKYVCPPQMCRMFCEFGFELDSYGCKRCSCAINPCENSLCPASTVCQLVSPKNCTLCAMKSRCIAANTVQRIHVQLHFAHDESVEIDIDDFTSFIKVRIGYMLGSEPEYIRALEVDRLDKVTTAVKFHIVSYGYWDLVSAYDRFYADIKTHNLGTAFKYNDAIFIPEHDSLSVRYYQNPDISSIDGEEEIVSESNSTVNVGLIIGCSIAGAVGLIIIIVVITCFCRQKKTDRPNVAYVRAPEPKMEKIVSEKPMLA